MNDEELQDQKIKKFLKQDKIISKKANETFDNFINDLKFMKQNCENNDKVIPVDFESKNNINKEKIKSEENISSDLKANNTLKSENNISSKAEAKKQEDTKENKVIHHKFKKTLTAVASLMVVLLGSNVYATKLGYDNIFFMIKEVYEEKIINSKEEIFSDRDIVISYQSFYITESVEMQINELQAEENKAKLILTIEELNTTELVPFKYKVYNEKNELMCDLLSAKEADMKKYKEALELSKFSDDTNIINLEVYSKDNKLLKKIAINLDDQTIEAKTENQEVKKISQVALNEFLKEQTELIMNKQEKNSKTAKEDTKSALILKLTDITYSDYQFIAKFLYITPTEEDYKDGNVENLPVYQNTVKFKLVNDEFELVEIEEPEKINL